METLGQYKLLQRIAIGGMAEIFLAEKPGPAGFSRRLAIKRILPHRADDAEFVEMFLNEARLAAMLNHPNIVQIYDLGEVEDTYYIAMEYVDGFDLGQILDKSEERGQSIPPAYVARLISQAAMGLHHAHNYRDPTTHEHLNLVHRDISLPNIMVSRDGIVKLLDFGIAKASNTDSQRDPTQTGVLKGKISYMSPEYLRGERIDGRHDLFALGVVMYELITGQKPFQAKGDVQMLQAILTQPPRDPYAFNASLPHQLVDITMKLLAKDPAERMQSGSEIQSSLENFLYQTGQQEVTQAHVADYIRQIFGLGNAQGLHEPQPSYRTPPPRQGSQTYRPPHQPAPSNRMTPPPSHSPMPSQNYGRPTSDLNAFQPMNSSQTPNWMVEETKALSLEQVALEAGLKGIPKPTSNLPGFDQADTLPPSADSPEEMGKAPTAPVPVMPEVPNVEAVVAEPEPDSKEPQAPPHSVGTGAVSPAPKKSSGGIYLFVFLCFLLGGGAAFGVWWFNKNKNQDPGVGSGTDVQVRRPKVRRFRPPLKVRRVVRRLIRRRPPQRQPIQPRPRVVQAQVNANNTGAVNPTPNQQNNNAAAVNNDNTKEPLVRYVSPRNVTPRRVVNNPTVNVQPRQPTRYVPPRYRPPAIRRTTPIPEKAVGIYLRSYPRCLVYWRGQKLGWTPRFFALPPGRHLLTLRKLRPHVRYFFRINLKPGQYMRKTIRIGEGLLIIQTNRSAKLYINGSYFARLTRRRFIRLHAGVHRIVARAGGRSIRRNIRIRKGGRFNLNLKF
ncbi:MAG: serine/threonine protein kinase [Deltaproteobacteria bacterium]|nr:MAG: serine/threonine protein kinase [Deltaproteobacteria bacterium]